MRCYPLILLQKKHWENGNNFFIRHLANKNNYLVKNHCPFQFIACALKIVCHIALIYHMHTFFHQCIKLNIGAPNIFLISNTLISFRYLGPLLSYSILFEMSNIYFIYISSRLDTIFELAKRSNVKQYLYSGKY